jgi:hypothetical protein
MPKFGHDLGERTRFETVSEGAIRRGKEATNEANMATGFGLGWPKRL